MLPVPYELVSCELVYRTHFAANHFVCLQTCRSSDVFSSSGTSEATLSRPSAAWGQVLYYDTMKTSVFISTCTVVQSMPHPCCGSVVLPIVMIACEHPGLRTCQVDQAYPKTTFCDGFTSGARYLCRGDFAARFPVVMVTCIRGPGGRLSTETSGAEGCCCRYLKYIHVSIGAEYAAPTWWGCCPPTASAFIQPHGSYDVSSSLGTS